MPEPPSSNHAAARDPETELLFALMELSLDTGDVTHVIRRSLEIIARAYGWAFAQEWVVNEADDILTCSEVYFAAARLPEFRQKSLERKMSKGVGLPGRAWATGLPLLLKDLSDEAGLSFTRSVPAANAGLRSAFALPIKNGPFVLAVYEFFSFEVCTEPQSDAFFEKIGRYIASLIAQKENEQLNRQREIEHKLVLDHAFAAFISIDAESIITGWTEQATWIFGWEKEEAIGKALTDLIIPERYREAHMKGLLRYMAKGTGVVIEKVVRAPALTKTGREIMIDLKIFPIVANQRHAFGAFIRALSKVQEPEIALT